MIFTILIALLWQARAPAKAPASRTATIHGKVLAEDRGSPLRFASVQLRRVATSQETITVSTDDSGAFEIHDIEPGAYFARAAKAGYISTFYKGVNDDSGQLKLSAGQVEEVIFRLPRTAVISGTITDLYGDPVDNATVQAVSKSYTRGRAQLMYRATAQTDDRGEFRLYNLAAGRYYLQASKRSNMTEAGVELATTLFPSAARLEDAQPIVLKAGDERLGVNVTLREAQLFDITGRVFDEESGQPVTNAFLNLMPMNGGGFTANDRAQADGAFRIRNVVAGHYTLMVSAPSQDRVKPPLSVTRYLDLSNGALNDLVIRVGPGSTVKGTLQSVGGMLSGEVQVSLQQTAPDGTLVRGFSATVADGAFEIDHLPPGKFEVQVGARGRAGPDGQSFFLSSASVALGSAAASRTDVTDKFLEIGDADSMQLSLTVDLRTATVSGKLRNAPVLNTPVLNTQVLNTDDTALPNMNVVLISADPKKRLISRYFHIARSGRDGSFKLQGLPPGDYLLMPWPGDDAGQVLDPDVLTMIENLATRVTVERGGTLTQDLRLTPELRTVADTFVQ